MPPNEYAYLDWFQGGLKHLGHEGERCARCLRHAVQFHGRAGTECSNCLPAQIILKRCTACKFVAYCSKECQRAHWSQHGGYCRRMSKGLNKMDILSKRLIWVVAWCKEHLPCLQAAARSLMRAASLDPAERYACIVDLNIDVSYVDTEAPGTARAVDFFPRIRNMRYVPLSEIHAILDTFYSCAEIHEMSRADTHVQIDVELAPCPDVVPLVVLDRAVARHSYAYAVHFPRWMIEDIVVKGMGITEWLEKVEPHAGCLEWVSGSEKEGEKEAVS